MVHVHTSIRIESGKMEDKMTDSVRRNGRTCVGEKNFTTDLPGWGEDII